MGVQGLIEEEGVTSTYERGRRLYSNASTWEEWLVEGSDSCETIGLGSGDSSLNAFEILWPDRLVEEEASIVATDFFHENPLAPPFSIRDSSVE